MNKKLLALYGLKFNPFASGLPTEALFIYPKLDSFCWRIENALLREGGFAMITGDPGTGKSVALRCLAERLGLTRDIQVGVLTHSSAKLADFYREMGDIFGVSLNAHNRWGGFKTLRERWFAHLESTLMRPVLLIDEAQEMPANVLNELRLLTSAQFDSRLLLTVVLAGDARLTDKLRRDELVPLGSRIRVRMSTEYASVEQLQACLMHLLQQAGNPVLMSEPLKLTLCEHAMGNYRVLVTMAAELLATAAQREITQLDEKLYFECFSVPQPELRKRGSSRG